MGDANNIPNVHNVVSAAYMRNHLLKQSTGLQVDILTNI